MSKTLNKLILIISVLLIGLSSNIYAVFPDYQAKMNLYNNIVNTDTGDINIAIDISEKISDANNTGDLQFSLIKNKNLKIVFNNAVVSDNINWEMSESNLFYNFKYIGNNNIFPAFHQSPVMLTGHFTTPEYRIGRFSFDVAIRDGSGDINDSNNKDTKFIIYDKHLDFLNSAPVITLNGKDNITLEMGKIYEELGASAVDTEDGDITSRITITSDRNIAKISTYYIYYDVVDSMGKEAQRIIRKVNVIMPGENFKIRSINTVEQTYNSCKVHWELSDYATGQIEYGKTTAYGNFNTKEKSYKYNAHIQPLINLEAGTTYHYRIISENKNKKRVVSEDMTCRTLSLADTTAPTITLVGNPTITLTKGSTYIEYGANAVDDVDGDIEVDINGTVNTNVIGTYTIQYKAEDNAGNSAVEERSVSVVDTEENHRPTAINIEIQGTAQTGQELSLIYTFVDSDGDSEGQTIIVWKIGTTELQRSTSKTFVIPAGYEGQKIYAAVKPFDEHGLQASPLYPSNQGMVITQGTTDTEAPVITLVGASSITLIKGSTYIEYGANAVDNVDGDITSKIKITNNVDTSKAGSYRVTYNVADKAGNDAYTVSRTVYVKEKVQNDSSLNLRFPEVFHIPEGETLEIYLDNIIDVGDAISTYSLKVLVDGYEEGHVKKVKGYSENQYWSYTCNNIGTKSLKLEIYNENNELVTEASAQLEVFDAPTVLDKDPKILILGDSLTAAGFYTQTLATKLNNQLSNNISFIGTHHIEGQQYPQEGWGGYKYGHFLSYKKSPFIYNEKLDMKRYFNENGKPDYLTIMLGVNDIISLAKKEPSNYDNLDIEGGPKLIPDTIDIANDLIAKIKSALPNVKILVASITSPNKGIFTYPHLYSEKYRKAQQLFIAKQKEAFTGREKENIYYFPTHHMIDNYNGYPKNNHLHPNELGYTQLGNTFYNELMWVLSKDSIEEPKEPETTGQLTLTGADSVIYYSDESLVETAQELSDVMYESSNIRIPISPTKQNNKKSISLQVENIPTLKKDGFVFESNENEIIIKANDAHSVAFGTYELLEKNLDVKYLFYHIDNIGVDIPKHSTLRFKKENRKEEPAFINRTYSGIKRLKDGSLNHYYIPSYYKHIRIYGSEISLNHFMHILYDPDTYKKTNPEFYPKDKIIDPKGIGWQPVFTADGIEDVAIIKIGQRFNFCAIEKNKDHDYCIYKNSYPIGVSDGVNGYGDAQTKGKSKNVLGYYNMSDVYYDWANKVAKGVSVEHSNFTLGALAYHEVLEAPSFKVDDVIRPYLTYSSINWLDDIRKERSKKLISDWIEKSNHLGVYDYQYGDELTGANKPFYKVPRMYTSTTAEFLKYASEQGVENYKAETYASDDMTEGYKQYMLAKLLWNPNIDIDEELRQWYESAVGKSSSIYLANYYQFWERFWKERVIPKSNWMYLIDAEYNSYDSDIYLNLLTKEDLDYLDTQMENMLSEASDGIKKVRAQFFYDGWIKVRNRAFNLDEFNIIAGNTDDYTKVMMENFDDNNNLPKGWTTWHEGESDDKIIKITSENKLSQQNSLKLSYTPKGGELARLLAYKTFKDSTYASQYCASVKVSNIQGGASLILNYEDNGNSKVALSSYSGTNSTWDTIAVCSDKANNAIKITKIRLSLRDTRAQNITAYFDDLEIYKR